MKRFEELKRRVLKRIRIKRADGIVIKHLDEVDIVPTLKCNLNCVMCHQSEIKCKPNMSLDDFKLIVSRLKKEKVSKVSLVGGEILVLPEIFEFIRELENNKIYYDLATNAVLLDGEKIKKLKNLKFLEKITTSLDGDKEIHNKIRRNPVAFQKTIENIRRLLDAGFRVNVGCVVQKANFKDIERIFNLICGLGVRDISFLLENYIEDGEKRASEGIIKKITEKNAEIFTISKENPLGRLNEIELSMLKEKFERIKVLAKRRGVSLGLPVQFLVKDILRKDYSLKCFTCSIFKGYNMQVNNDSTLSFCPFISLGEDFSLKRRSLLNTANSSEYLSLRRLFHKNGALPICRRCCALVEK